MKKQPKGLKLSRETLRALSGQSLTGAAGGATNLCNTATACTAVSCPTNCAGATCLPCANTSTPTNYCDYTLTC